MYPPNALGFHDVYGNVWEWSEDQFNGLPGFETNYLYDDFSSPCFDGLHTMMMVRCELAVPPMPNWYIAAMRVFHLSPWP